MWIKAENGMYLCEVHGVCYLTWVAEKDRSHAAIFPRETISQWIDVFTGMAGMKLEAVAPA